jgi:hypothetical protein
VDKKTPISLYRLIKSYTIITCGSFLFVWHPATAYASKADAGGKTKNPAKPGWGDFSL